MEKSRQNRIAPSEERHRAEAALLRSEEHFAAFMNHLPGAAWVKDLRGRYVYANPEAQRIFDRPLPALLGKTDEEIFAPQTAREFRENDQRALAQGGALQTTEVLHQAEGVDHYCIVSKFSLPGPGGQAAFIAGVAFDVTEGKRTEQALRESEGRLRMMTETLPAVPWTARTDGWIEYFSDKWLDWTGLTHEQALGHGWKLAIHPADLPRVLQAAAHSIRTGEPFNVEHRLRRIRGGSYRWYRSRALPQRDETGRILRWHGITDDVHELKTALEAVRQSERELREREQRLRLALETAVLGSYERDLMTGAVHLDPNCRAILGVPPGPVDPEVARKSLLPEDVGWVLARVARAYDPERREICAGEFRIRRPDGTLRWVAARGRVIFDDTVAPPRAIKFLGVLHDITEQKLGEELLQNQNRRLSLLSQATAKLLLAERPDQMVAAVAGQLPEWLLVDGILQLGVNDENGRELSVQGCWGIGQDLQEQELGHLDAGQGVSGTVARERRPLILTSVQESTHPKAGLIKRLGFQAYACYPLIVGERLLGTLAFASRRRERFDARDLEFFETLAGYVALAQERGRLNQVLRRHAQTLTQTVEERTAKLQDLVAELEHFSYSITHDMRAPLRAIQGFAEFANLACEADKPREVRQYLERICSSAQRMDCLVKDALDYSRSVRQELPLEDVDTDRLLRGMLETYPELEASRLHVQVEGRLPVVRGNQAGLTQCLSNLLENAVKFAKPEQVPQIRVWAEVAESPKQGPQAGGGAWVRIYVEDKGIGIAAGLLPRVFDMFSRGNKKVAGTGIGLALVRKVTQRMGGWVGVESEEGVGSRFWLELRKAEPAGAGGGAREGKDYESF